MGDGNVGSRERWQVARHKPLWTSTDGSWTGANRRILVRLVRVEDRLSDQPVERHSTGQVVQEASAGCCPAKDEHRDRLDAVLEHDVERTD